MNIISIENINISTRFTSGKCENTFSFSILRDTELAAKTGFQKSTRLERGAVFSAIESECMAERYGAPTSSRSSSANDALTALAAADLSSRGSSPLPRRLRPPTSPPLQENPMQTQWTRGAQPHSFQKRARATLARLELAA